MESFIQVLPLHFVLSLRVAVVKQAAKNCAFNYQLSIISPILTYNSEVWGAYVKSDLKSWDSSQVEKTHFQFCKRYLEVSNKASNVAYRAELGRFPIIIAINQKRISLSLVTLLNQSLSIIKQIFSCQIIITLAKIVSISSK